MNQKKQFKNFFFFIAPSKIRNEDSHIHNLTEKFQPIQPTPSIQSESNNMLLIKEQKEKFIK
jgi:hypothetical protein